MFFVWETNGSAYHQGTKTWAEAGASNTVFGRICVLWSPLTQTGSVPMHPQIISSCLWVSSCFSTYLLCTGWGLGEAAEQTGSCHWWTILIGWSCSWRHEGRAEVPQPGRDLGEQSRWNLKVQRLQTINKSTFHQYSGQFTHTDYDS